MGQNVQTHSGALISPGRVVGHQQVVGAAYTADGLLIEQSLRLARSVWQVLDPEKTEIDVRDCVQLEEGVYLGHFFSHFGHFLVETLPTLRWASQFPELPLIFHRWPTEDTGRDVFRYDHVARMFDMCEIERTRLCLVGEPMRVGHLHVPPRPIDTSKGPAIDYSDFLKDVRSRLVEEGETASPLYLSRRRFSSPSRTFSNEEAVENVFRDAGFRVVFPETLSFREQLGLVANAPMVGGLDGSALHLGMFMAAGARVLVLKSRSTLIGRINDLVGVTTIELPVCDTFQVPGGTDTSVRIDDLQSALASLLERS